MIDLIGGAGLHEEKHMVLYDKYPVLTMPTGDFVDCFYVEWPVLLRHGHSDFFGNCSRVISVEWPVLLRHGHSD